MSPPESLSTSRVASHGNDDETPSPDSADQHDEPLTLYKMIVTPVNFVTFLVSLVLVDLRYTRLRMHSHHSVRESKLPTWLHDILYYRQPYDDVGGRRPGGSRERWHYHSNQKKLMKMEAEEAFRLRGTVLLFLAVLAATATGGTLYVANRLLSGWHGSQMRG